MKLAEHEELGHIVPGSIGLHQVAIEDEREPGQRAILPNQERIPAWLRPVTIQVGVRVAAAFPDGAIVQVRKLVQVKLEKRVGEKQFLRFAQDDKFFIELLAQT